MNKKTFLKALAAYTRTLKKHLLILLSIVLILTAGIRASYAQINPSKMLNTSMVWHDERFDKVIYLTFDDGPFQKNTAEILDILKKNNVKATFFLLGERVEMLPAVALRIKREGHLIGDHTYSHKNLTLIGREDLKKELSASREAFKKYLNYYPDYFRPPSGIIDQRALRELAPYRSKIIMWDVDPQDWHAKSASQIYGEVVKHAAAGSIIVLHDNVKATAQALPLIIQHFKSLGYRFETVDNIFKPRLQILSSPVYRLVKEEPVRLFEYVSSSN